MKVRKVKLSIALTLVLLSGVIGIVIGYHIRGDSTPTNCAELGATYLEVGRKELGITDFGSEQWKKLIEDETKFTNDCYKSLEK